MNKTDLEEWSHQSEDNFKTIVSESETRNPTTNKKKNINNNNKNINNQNKYMKYIDDQQEEQQCYQYSNIRPMSQNQKYKNNNSKSKRSNYCKSNNIDFKLKNMCIDELRSQIHYLQRKKQNYIKKKNYPKVSKIQEKLCKTIQNFQDRQIGQLKEYHIMEQNKLYQEHLHEMKEFDKTWRNIFQQYVHKQQKLVNKITKQQEIDVQKVNRSFQGKVEKVNARFQNQLKRIDNQLTQEEDCLLDLGRYDLLANSNIQKNRKKIKRQAKLDRSYLLDSMQKAQEKKLTMKYQRRYSSLKMKAKEQKDTQIKVYQKQEEILRQKFLNWLSKMHHQQHMELLDLKTKMDKERRDEVNK